LLEFLVIHSEFLIVVEPDREFGWFQEFLQRWSMKEMTFVTKTAGSFEEMFAGFVLEFIMSLGVFASLHLLE